MINFIELILNSVFKITKLLSIKINLLLFSFINNFGLILKKIPFPSLQSFIKNLPSSYIILN